MFSLQKIRLSGKIIRMIINEKKTEDSHWVVTKQILVFTVLVTTQTLKYGRIL